MESEREVDNDFHSTDVFWNCVQLFYRIILNMVCDESWRHFFDHFFFNYIKTTYFKTYFLRKKLNFFVFNNSFKWNNWHVGSITFLYAVITDCDIISYIETWWCIRKYRMNYFVCVSFCNDEAGKSINLSMHTPPRPVQRCAILSPQRLYFFLFPLLSDRSNIGFQCWIVYSIDFIWIQYIVP